MKTAIENFTTNIFITWLFFCFFIFSAQAEPITSPINGTTLHPANLEIDPILPSVAASSTNINRSQNKGFIDCMIEPFLVIDVASSTSGVIKEVMVDRGSIIEKNQVLATLESGVEKANADHASAKLSFHKKKLKRMSLLFQQNVITDHEFEEAETEVELANHEYQRALKLLDMRTIKSPFAGIVVDRFISPGELTEQQKVLKIAQLDPLKIEMIAPVTIYGTVSRGMVANVRPEGPLSGPFEAEIHIVDKIVDAASGTFGISLLLENQNYEIPAGVRCTAQIDRSKKLSTRLSDKYRSKPTRKTNTVKIQNVNNLKTNKTFKYKKVINGTTPQRKSTSNEIVSLNTSIKIPELSEARTISSNFSKPTIAELQDVIVKLINAYEVGDIHQFESLFSESATTNHNDGLDSIKEDYRDLFENSNERQLFITNLDWTFERNQAKGTGEAHGIVMSSDNNTMRVFNKRIHLVTEKRQGKVFITHLYHYEP